MNDRHNESSLKKLFRGKSKRSFLLPIEIIYERKDIATLFDGTKSQNKKFLINLISLSAPQANILPLFCVKINCDRSTAHARQCD
ncbi:MAG: hypothetical protein SCALA701_04100 [Candidatus Scalindua sp.]|nr:MAG: hypothetical protein SCALA701_04100 [Candidatus Scalindua sp.]